MHKGDYHTDYSKYYDKEYKNKDMALEHVKKIKKERRDENIKEEVKKKKNILAKKRIVKKNS